MSEILLICDDELIEDIGIGKLTRIGWHSAVEFEKKKNFPKLNF